MTQKNNSHDKKKQIKKKYDQSIDLRRIPYKKGKETNLLYERAKKAGYKESEVNQFIKSCSLHNEILSKIQTDKGYAVHEDLIFQLKKVGVNLNQIARALNQRRPEIDSERLKDTIKNAVEIVNKIDEQLKRTK